MKLNRALAFAALIAVVLHGRAKLGIGYMPEDRRLIPDLTVEENILLPAWAIGAGRRRSGSPPSTTSFPRRASSRTGARSNCPAVSRSSPRWHEH